MATTRNITKSMLTCGFQDSASVVTGTLGEGRFVLFFPTELHKPGLVQHGCVGVRKAVVKIRMED